MVYELWLLFWLEYKKINFGFAEEFFSSHIKDNTAYSSKTIKSLNSLIFVSWTYSNNRGQSSKRFKGVFDILKVDFTSFEGASTLLEAWVLSTDWIGKVLLIADLIFTRLEKERFLTFLSIYRFKLFQHFASKGFSVFLSNWKVNFMSKIKDIVNHDPAVVAWR